MNWNLLGIIWISGVLANLSLTSVLGEDSVLGKCTCGVRIDLSDAVTTLDNHGLAEAVLAKRLGTNGPGLAIPVCDLMEHQRKQEDVLLIQWSDVFAPLDSGDARVMLLREALNVH